MRAVLLTLAALLATVGPAFVVKGQAPNGTRFAFDVASVKQNNDRGRGQLRYNPAGVDFSNVPLSWIIGEAYDVPYSRVSGPDVRSRESLLSGMSFDVSAKAEKEVPKELIRQMLQTLLAERFKLTLHHEAKNESVYKLVGAKNGPKLQESKTDVEPTVEFGLTGFAFRNVDMTRFASVLSTYQDRPVLDSTGLGGHYDFTLSVPEPIQATAEGKRSLIEWLSSSLFTDIQRQLGLQLVADKASLDYLVVDHVEMPAEN